MENIYVSDATLRLESNRTDTAPSFREKLEIARSLDRLRLYGVELPKIENEKADVLLIKSIAAAVRESRLVLPCALTKKGVELAWSAVSAAKKPCLQITVPTSTAQMEYICHKKPDKILLVIEELVSYAKSLCPSVEFCAGDATRSDAEFLGCAVETAIAAGADSVTLCDGSDGMLPDEFGDFLADLYKRAPSLSKVLTGVECTNALDLAAACAMRAVKEGARLIKTSCGDDAPLSLETFAAILRARGMEHGLDSGIAMTELRRTAGQVRWMVSAKRGANTPYDNSVQRQADENMRLSAASGPAEIAAAVEKLGYELSEEDAAKVYAAFLRIAGKKSVGEKELDAIVASAALQVPPTYTLESYVINSGNVITATAHIKLLRQGETKQGFGLGDGPIDAAFLAIEQIIGHHYELDDFQIQAVTEGREAMGSALVRLRADGKLYSGKGISTDIIGASIHAYLNALNKIVYEEGGRQ